MKSNWKKSRFLFIFILPRGLTLKKGSIKSGAGPPEVYCIPADELRRLISSSIKRCAVKGSCTVGR